MLAFVFLSLSLSLSLSIKSTRYKEELTAISRIFPFISSSVRSLRSPLQSHGSFSIGGRGERVVPKGSELNTFSCLVDTLCR